ncbi:hypothetical protein ACO0RG_002949 [Hanseniaspora osmophila]
MASVIPAIARKKIIVIVGTTGVGKSQLSIDLASKFNGEVINSDSMQVYKHVSTVNNKHPLEERNGIPHHVMDLIDLDDDYNIHKFEKDCLQSIRSIHSRGKLPIVVGGTHYYLQSLFDKKIDQDYNSDLIDPNHKLFLEENDSNYKVLYERLCQIDPYVSTKFHPNDGRRIKRMLEIFYSTGQKPSDIFTNQKFNLKFDTLFLWVYSNPAELSARLDLRVDKMMKVGSGGLEDVQLLYKLYQHGKMTPQSLDHGIWQVIGFKEFLPWLLDGEQDAGKFQEGIERMKIKTRQYAKSQVKWIKNTLIPDIKGSNMYILDATDLSKWHQLVAETAEPIVQKFLEDDKALEGVVQAPDHLQSLLESDFHKNSKNVDNPKTLNLGKKYVCEICHDKDQDKLIFIGDKSWSDHLNGRKHRTTIRKTEKRKNYEIWKLKQQNTEENETAKNISS